MVNVSGVVTDECLHNGSADGSAVDEMVEWGLGSADDEMVEWGLGWVEGVLLGVDGLCSLVVDLVMGLSRDALLLLIPGFRIMGFLI